MIFIYGTTQMIYGVDDVQLSQIANCMFLWWLDP